MCSKNRRGLRGGAAMVDRLAAKAGADLRRACFLFGEKLVYLKRAGVGADDMPFERWQEFFQLAKSQAVLWQAWEQIARAMVLQPDRTVSDIVLDAGLGKGTPGQHAAGNRPDETLLGAGAYTRPHRGDADDAPIDRTRDHRPGTPQRLPDHAVWLAGNRGVCSHALEVAAAIYRLMQSAADGATFIAICRL